MFYVNKKIKNMLRVPQPEGRRAYIRLDQNENPDGASQWLLDSVMEKVNHDGLLPELKEQYIEGKNYIAKALKDNGYETLPSEGCYVCIKPKHKTSRKLMDLFEERGILILCGKDGLTDWLRLTIAHKKYMEIFMKAPLELDK